MNDTLKNVNFSDYYGNKKIGLHDSNFYVIVPANYSDPRPLFCSICECAMNTVEDHRMHEKLGCCVHCSDEFYYKNKKEWDSGWRPEKKKDCNHVKTIIIRE